GEAAVGVATATEFAMADDTIAELLSSTQKVLPAEAPVRVELLAGVARSLPRNDPAAIVTARHAVNLARRLAPPRQGVTPPAASIIVTGGPQEVSQGLADIEEVIERAEHLEWIELAVEARGWRAATLQQLGRDREALAETAIVHSWAERARRPFFLALASMHTIAAHLRSGSTAAADA